MPGRGPTEWRLQDRESKAVAKSLGLPSALRDSVPDLFRGVQVFGSDRRLLLRMLRSSGIGTGHRLADVACGRGSLALSAASSLGCRAVGIDAFEPFILDARRMAARRGLSDLTSFHATSLENWRPRQRFDAVAMVGLLPPTGAARACRRLLCPGGLLFVDDLVPASPTGQARAVKRARLGLERPGYSLEEVRVAAPEPTRASMARLHARLRTNAARLARRRPGLNPAIDDFLAYLRAAEETIPSRSIPAYWVLRRLT